MKVWSLKNGVKIVRVLSGRSNSFIITNGSKNILVDTGPGFMVKILERNLTRLGISEIAYLVLTHSHFDHAANAHFIKGKYNAAVIIHQLEAHFLETGSNIVPFGTNPVTRVIGKLFAESVIKRSGYNPCSAELTFNEGLDLSESGINVRIIHTPGHTPGSSSIIVCDKIALVGDTMFGVFKNSVFPPWADDVKALLESWRKLLETGCTVFLPSHGSENSLQLVKTDYIRRLNKLFTEG
jgi:glyoxylase-like metal-dependent hydrolase (beta-lactamase superfamily II)